MKNYIITLGASLMKYIRVSFVSVVGSFCHQPLSSPALPPSVSSFYGTGNQSLSFKLFCCSL